MDNKNEKPKIVASIDVNVQFVPKVSKKAWLEESIDDHLQCVLCGTHLNFTHKADFIAGTVHEEAHCASCGVRNRQSDYILQ